MSQKTEKQQTPKSDLQTEMEKFTLQSNNYAGQQKTADPKFPLGSDRRPQKSER
jgi:hypothetical protein